MAGLLLAGCPRPSEVATVDAGKPGDSFLAPGSVDERFERAAKHLRGLDVAMVEIGYRYGELHWAGVDRNWPYAAYQLEKIELAMTQAVERRPKRAESARMLTGPIDVLQAAVQTQDGKAFDDGFIVLTAACNQCHQVEKMPTLVVVPPAVRCGVVRAPDGGG